ncbi:MAG: YggT family protein [Myxococcales bacterium]|nr:YggT family protein [Myxococcales bacterium]
MQHLITGLQLLVFGDALFSWFLSPDTPPRAWTKPLLDPVYEPVRNALSPTGLPIDLAPLLALAVLYGIQKMLERPSGRNLG